MRLLFARATAPFRAHDFRCSMLRSSVQPAREHGMPRKRCGFPRESREYNLRHVLRAVCITGHLSQRGRVDQVDVSPHELGKRGLGLFFSVTTKEFGVGGHGSSSHNPRPIPNRTKKLSLSHRLSRYTAASSERLSSACFCDPARLHVSSKLRLRRRA
jgi:hypothetical protein